MDRSTDLAIEAFESSLRDKLTPDEVVHSIDYSLCAAMTAPNQMSVFGVLHIALKSPVLGKTIAHFDIHDPQPVLGGSRDTVDLIVRNCLESIRNQRAVVLAGTNGHSALV